MQFYLKLYFSGTVEELFVIIASFLKNESIDYDKKYEKDGSITVVTDYYVIWINTPDESDKISYRFLKEDYGVTVDHKISFQLYPDGTDEMICRLVSRLLESIDGDLYLTSESDDDILYRHDELYIKPSWKKYFENK